MDHLHPGRYRGQGASSGSSQGSYQQQQQQQYQQSWSNQSSPSSSSQPFQPPAALSPLEQLVRRGRDVAAAPPTKSAIYDKAFALSRSTSIKRQPRLQDEPADDDDTRSIDLMGVRDDAQDDEERQRESKREQVRQQRQNRQRQSGTPIDAGPGSQRFPDVKPQQAQAQDEGRDDFISGAFRDSMASTASFNTITGDDERTSMLGGPGSGGSVDEDVAHALSRLEARRRRDSIDTVMSSEFAEGGRWGRAWASKADDEESMYSNDDDDDDEDGELEAIRLRVAATAAGAKSGGPDGANGADWRLSASDLEGKGAALLCLAAGAGGLASIKALGKEQRQQQQPSQQSNAAQLRNGQVSQPRLHTVDEPRSARLEGISHGAAPSTMMDGVSAQSGQYVHRYDPSSNGLRRRGSGSSIAHSIAPSVHDAGTGGYYDDEDEDGSAGLGISRRDTLRSIVPEVGNGVGDYDYGYGGELAARKRDSSATIGAASERSTGSSGSGSGSGSSRSGQSNAHVYVWPPTPAGSNSGHGQATAQQQQQRDMVRAQAQRAHIETAPAPALVASGQGSRSAAPVPVGPSAVMARGLGSPILGPDGTARRVSGPQLRQQASRASLLKSGHPAGRAPPPTPPMGNAGYWDPNRPGPTSPTSPNGDGYGAPGTNNGPPVLGKFRQKAIADRDGRESMVSDLDVETLKLDVSSRRGSTSTVGSRMSVGTVKYDDEMLRIDSPLSESGSIPGAWPGANVNQGYQQQQQQQQQQRYQQYQQPALLDQQRQQQARAPGAGQQPRSAQPGPPRTSFDTIHDQHTRSSSGPGPQVQQRYSLEGEGAHMQTPRAQTPRIVGPGNGSSAFLDAKSQMPPPIKRSPPSQQQQQQQQQKVGDQQRPPPSGPRLSSEMASASSTVSSNAATLASAPLRPGMAKSKGSYTSQRSNASSANLSPAVDTKTGPSAAEAFLTLGIEHHETGDLARSAYYFERSARVEGGCVVGMCMWGMALREGWGARKDPKRGFEWISRAAARAGEMMQGSQKKTESELKAIRSELKLSVFELGKCFCYGWGVKMDKRMALEYFELAAKLGDADAQAEAGALLAAGKGGIRKDKKKAAMYYRMAEAQGYDTIGLSWIHKQSLMD